MKGKTTARLLSAVLVLLMLAVGSFPAGGDETQERLSRNLYGMFFTPERPSAKPSLKGYTLPLGATSFVDSDGALGALGEDAAESLRKDGFALTFSLQAPDLLSWLEEAEKRGLPLLITTDLTAYLTWRVLSKLRAMRTSEQNLRGLEHLAAAMVDRLASEEGALVEKSGVKGKACRLALRYFSVLICLLSGSSDVCDETAAGELALIRAAEKPAPSLLFGYRLDYSRFKLPEGVAPDSREGRAFLAVRWLSEPSFVLPDAPQVGNDVTREQARIQTVAAALISVFLFENVWYPYFHRFYQLGSLISGTSPVLTTYDYMEPLEAVVGFCGNPLPLADEAVLTRFVDSLRSRKPLEPHSFFVLPRKRPPEGKESPAFFEAPYAMHLEPPRQLLADAICRRLLYPFVGKFIGSGEPVTGKPARVYPTPWDLVILFGDRTAERFLRAEKITSYSDYKTELERIRAFLNGLDERARNCSFETGWLFSLERLAGRGPKRSQPFVGTQEWEMRRVLAMLTNWYLLEAVAKAPAASGGGRSRPFTFGAVFVEPEYEWYCALLQNLKALSATLRSLGIDMPEARDLTAFVEGCRDLSACEITGRKPEGRAKKFMMEAGALLASLVGDGKAPRVLTFEPSAPVKGRLAAAAFPCATLAVAADAGGGRAKVFAGPCLVVRTAVVKDGADAADKTFRDPRYGLPRGLRGLVLP